MNKGQLIDLIAKGSDVTKAEANRVIDTFMITVIDALKSGNDVVLPGFGSFSVAERSERNGRNPQTGAPIKIKASKVAKFKAGISLKKAVQEA